MRLIFRELSAAILWVASAFCVLWGLTDWDAGRWPLAIIGLYLGIVAATVSASVLIHRARLERHATVEDIVRMVAVYCQGNDGDDDGGRRFTRVR